MKTSVLKKSILDYAIKGALTAKFRRENKNLNAFSEIENYNAKILTKKENLENQIKTLESKLKKASKSQKDSIKEQIKTLKKELEKCKIINILESTFTPPFEIPPTWAWVKLEDICESNRGLTYSPNNIKQFGIPVLRANNIQNGIINYENLIYVDENMEIKENCFAKKEDILMCATNGSSKLVGKVALIEKENMAFGAFMSIIRSPYNIFLKYYFESQCFRNQLEGFSTTTINQITQNMLKNFTIPLPPLKEQEEIARTLDILVKLANDFDNIKEELKRIEKRIEKSLLKIAINGNLSKGYRRANPDLNAFSEIEKYNNEILKKREILENEIENLESKLEIGSKSSLRGSETSKAIHKENKKEIQEQIKTLKKELEKYKIINILNLSPDLNKHKENENLTKNSIENCSFQYKII